MTEENTVVRSRRLRKKLHLEEFAITGFEFTCNISADEDGSYDSFFTGLKSLVDARNLFIQFDHDNDQFIGFVTSAARYGNVTEDDKSALATAFDTQANISDVNIGELVDAFYG